MWKHVHFVVYDAHQGGSAAHRKSCRCSEQRQQTREGGPHMKWLIRVVLGAIVILIVFTAAAAGWIATRPLTPLRSPSGPNPPDLVVQMSEDYLNRIASGELSQR